MFILCIVDHQSVLTCSRDDTLRNVDLRSCRVVQSMSAPGFKVSSDYSRATIAPDGAYAAAGSMVCFAYRHSAHLLFSCWSDCALPHTCNRIRTGRLALRVERGKRTPGALPLEGAHGAGARSRLAPARRGARLRGPRAPRRPLDRHLTRLHRTAPLHRISFYRLSSSRGVHSAPLAVLLLLFIGARGPDSHSHFLASSVTLEAQYTCCTCNLFRSSQLMSIYLYLTRENHTHTHTQSLTRNHMAPLSNHHYSYITVLILPLFQFSSIKAILIEAKL